MTADRNLDMSNEALVTALSHVIETLLYVVDALGHEGIRFEEMREAREAAGEVDPNLFAHGQALLKAHQEGRDLIKQALAALRPKVEPEAEPARPHLTVVK